MMSSTALIAFALSAPLVGAALIAASSRLPNLREGVTMITALFLAGAVGALSPAVLAGFRPELHLLDVLPGLPLAFRVEPLGMLFALVASALWVLNSLYSFGYMRANDEQRQTRFYVCFALALASTIGIAYAANMFTLFVFYELLTLVTYPLVAHHGTDQARRGGRTYIALLIGTSTVLLLPAVVYTWFAAGSTDFVPGGILAGRVSDVALVILLALYMFGLGKAALMPFHRWLPAAMVAPTPVSALLHAVAVVKAGVFSVVKVVVYILGVDALAASAATGWLIVVAGFTIVAASIVALRADNLKRRLAYSTVSQLSYVVMATALLAPLSIVGAILHIAAHAFSKITLFFAAGAIYTAAHKTEVSQLDGIGRRMPWTMSAFAVGALSLIGVPPLVGFVSKWLMMMGALDMRHWLAATVILGSTLLNAAYFLPILHRAFFRAPAADDHAHGEAPLPMVIALTATAAATVAAFFFNEQLLALARGVAGLEAP
jgi:multicomponent Na+:H+ antiporter subunit D